MRVKESAKKRILLMGINFAPELTGIGRYTGEMVDWMIKQGYECTVVTSFPYYPHWKVQAPYQGKYFHKECTEKGCLTVYRCPMFVPNTPTGLKRVLHELTFCFTAFLVTFMLLFKPRHDHIFCMAPPFLLGFLALFYRFFKGGKMLYHIHDMEIEAARDLKVLKAKHAFRLLFIIERYILNKTDFVSTVAVGMLKKISKKVDKEILFFPNWVDTKAFYPIADKAILKKAWNFDLDDKVVLYSGSIGEKQGLEAIINIANNLQHLCQIKFVISGTGPYKNKLAEQAKALQLTNIHFLPLQQPEVFNNFINMADLHLVIQKENACDLMMPSKLSTILAAGGFALVTANKGTNLYEIIENYDMGVVIEAENEQLLKTEILKCLQLKASHFSSNGRTYAEKFLDIDSILPNILHQMEQVSEGEFELDVA